MYKFKRRHVKLIKTTWNYCKLIENPEKISAIQYNPVEKTLEIIKKIKPGKIVDETVLVKTAYAGISGTDLKIIRGEYPVNECAPVIPGHEIVGFVCSKSAANFEIGDRVAVNPTRGCQLCDQCRDKNEHHCTETPENHLGITQNGGWQNYCLVPTKQLHKIPANVSTAAAIFAHPVSCIWHAWRLMKPVAPTRKILIIGAGFIGNLFAAFCHFNGLKCVTICEENIKKLNVTVKLNTCYDLITPDMLEQRVIKSQNSYLFDVIVDCSGNSKAVEMAVNLLDYGGRFCIFGTANADAEIQISPYEVFRKELDIFAPKFNPYSFPDAFSIIAAMSGRYVDYGKLGVELFQLCDYRQALSCLRQGTIAKAVFCFVEPENNSM